MRHLKLVDNESGQMPLLIAFASSDRHQVNQHFGAAEAFVIYRISDSQHHLMEVMEYSGSDIQKDHNEDKLQAKIELLKECSAVYCTAIGTSAIKKLMANGVQAIRVDEGLLIETLIRQLQRFWHSQPPTWLQRALRQKQQASEQDRFDRMAEEGWQP